MRFIIHQVNTSNREPQSEALAEALAAELEWLGYDYQQSTLTGDPTRYGQDYFIANASELHVVMLVGVQKRQTLEHFNSMQNRPLIAWGGGAEVLQQMQSLDIAVDFSLLPGVLLNAKVEADLSANTKIIKLSNRFMPYSQAATDHSMAQVVQNLEVAALSSWLNNRNLVTVQLDGDIEDDKGELIQQFSEAEAKTLACSIATHLKRLGIADKSLTIMVAPGLNTGCYSAIGEKLEDNPRRDGEVDDVTLAFMMELENQLKDTEFELDNIIGLPTTKDLLEPALAMFELANQAKKGLCFIPCSDPLLEAQSRYIYDGGSSVISYGRVFNQASKALCSEGRFSLMTYGGDFEPASPEALNSSLGRSRSMNLLCQELLSIAEDKEREARRTTNSSASLTFFEQQRQGTNVPKQEQNAKFNWQFWGSVAAGAVISTCAIGAIALRKK